MSDQLPEHALTTPELADWADVEPRVIWRAIQRGEIAATRTCQGRRHSTAVIAPTECARVIRACAVAHALGMSPGDGILRAADVQIDGHTVTLTLPVTDSAREVVAV